MTLNLQGLAIMIYHEICIISLHRLLFSKKILT